MELYSGDIIRVRDYPFNDSSGRGKSRYAVFLSKIGDEVLLAPATQIGTLSGRASTIPERPFEVKIPEYLTIETGITGVVKCDRFPLISQDQLIGNVVGRLPMETRIQMIERYKDLAQNYSMKRFMDRENQDHPKIMENFKDVIISEKLHFVQGKKHKYEAFRGIESRIKGVHFHPQKEGVPFQQVSLFVECYDLDKKDKNTYKASITTSDDKEVFLRKLQSIKTTQDVLQLDSRYHVLQVNLSMEFKNINYLHNSLNPQHDFRPLQELAQEVLDERVKEHEIWLGTDGREGKQLILNVLDFSTCEIKSEDLQQSILYRCQLHEMDLNSKNFHGSEFDLCSFKITNLDSANLSNVTFQDCNLIRTNLSKTILENTRFVDMELMPGSNNSDKEVPKIYFQEPQMKNVEFENTKFSPTLLDRISKENIRGITIREKEFSGLSIHIKGEEYQLLSKRGNPIEHANFGNFNDAKQGLTNFLQFEKSRKKEQVIDRD